jgi:hypothetical protein
MNIDRFGKRRTDTVIDSIASTQEASLRALFENGPFAPRGGSGEHGGMRSGAGGAGSAGQDYAPSSDSA